MSTKQTPNEVEEVKDLEQVEEVQDLTEVPDEVKEAVKEVKAPVMRGGGLRGAADPNMIQKHIDNFLAMLCGETPVDSNVRTSAEYWLKRLATGEGAGSTKKVYWHTIYFKREGASVWYADGYMIILNNDPTPITVDAFKTLLETPGFFGVVFNGRMASTTATSISETTSALTAVAYNSTVGQMTAYYMSDSNHARADTELGLSYLQVTDLGVNPIN